MDRKIIATELYKIAKELLAESDYIYDPDHKKHPSGGYVKTEKGWTKNKKDEQGEKPSGDSKKTSPKTEMTDEQKKLDKMADDKDGYIRRIVIDNPDTSPETLDKLSNDERSIIRCMVAKHKNTSPGTLDKLSNDKNYEVTWAVVENPNTSHETLDKMADDKDGYIRKHVAMHHNTSSETLDKLSKDKNNAIKFYVAQNRNTSSKTLDKLSKSKYMDIRLNVAANPHTHEQTLFRLFDDENKQVAYEARENLQRQRLNHIVDMMKSRTKKEQEELLEDLDPEERKDIWKQYQNR